jgi:hypothetical protein
MKTFLAVFTGSPAAFAEFGALDAEARKQREQEGLAAWHKWMQDNAARIVDEGGPLGKTKAIGKGGVRDTSNNLLGYVRLQGDSHEEVARLFEGHPSFTLFPGEGVEVMEILPIPGR